MASLFPKPISSAQENSAEYQRLPFIAPSGFREYDARWLFGEQINLMGFQALGLGLANVLFELSGKAEIIVAHDYRSYSQSIKFALINGLVAGGAKVHDIGLALSPIAYFARKALGIDGVAMVTASHNENGWSGVKMGHNQPMTFGPDEMVLLKKYVMENVSKMREGGAYHYVDGFAESYLAELGKRPKMSNKMKAVVACGNGTAGAFAPSALEASGVEVVPLHCNLDYNFPHHNPNPEDMAMLEALSEEVRKSKADIGFAFDGDGDRCGVVDEKGEEIFADKIGLLLARSLAGQYPNARFVVDVKSTGLFMTDPVLKERGAETLYWKTGHSYMKQYTHEQSALAGFEKSGHYFLSPPLGHGYDDGILSALLVCEMLDAENKPLSEMKAGLGESYNSPTCSPHCPDEEKYGVVEKVVAHFKAQHEKGGVLAGQKIKELILVNGVRVVLEDGSFGLVRASSNKPALVVVVESVQSAAHMKQIFAELAEYLAGFAEVGEYDQRP